MKNRKTANFSYLIINMIHLLSEFLKSVAFFLGHPAVAAPDLKNREKWGGGDFDVIFQSKGIPN